MIHPSELLALRAISVRSMPREIKINGPSRLVYDPHNCILSCGARLVIEADASSIEVVR
jgi:hypothetical protein